MGSAPIGNTGGVEYVVEVYASGSTFGPGTIICEIPDAVNLGWSCYDRLPGKAFFTLPQTSSLINTVNVVTPGTLTAGVPATYHVAIWRITTAGATLVFRGILMDTSDVGDDVVYSAYDYKALLSLSRSGFKTLYPTKLLGTEIVSPEWVLAKTTTTFSPLAFVTTGTIENPLDTLGVTPIKTNTQFGTLDQHRLQLFYDISEMGRANTANRVTFEITLANVFNFWKNQGGTAPFELVLNGTVSDYDFTPGWTHFRDDLATLGVGATGGSAEITASAGNDILAAMSRRQDVATLKTLAGIAGGLTETDQQKAALEGTLFKLLHYPGNLATRVERGTVDPSLVLMNDKVPIEVVNGRDTLTTSPFIVGKRVFYDENGEDLDIMLDYDVGIVVAGS